MEAKEGGRCGECKPLDDFNKRESSKDGKQSYCRECNRKRSRRYYSDHHDHHIAVIRAYRQRRRLLWQGWINAIKAANGCALCRETDPVCLEFHHPDPTTKKFDVGACTRLCTRWGSVVEEIQKCVVLCSNCHKKVHAGRESVDNKARCDPKLGLKSSLHNGTVA